MSEQALVCVRCHQPVLLNPEYYEVHERMHWLCFHLEYEHQTDSDGPCGDPSCPWWHIQVLREKLAALGYDPQEVMYEALSARWKQ